MKINEKIKNKKGFTLVELLVVLAVLAIISAIAIPKFAGVQEQAKIKADEESVKLIQTAVDLYMAANNETVPTMAQLIAVGNAYLKNEPTPAVNGHTFKIDPATGTVTCN